MRHMFSIMFDKIKIFDPSSIACICVLLFMITNSACNKKADESRSDSKAIEIANQVIEACGGQASWESTRYVTWRNFGKRLQVWDKNIGDIRVENDMTIVLMNVNTGKGRAWKYGEELTDPNDLQRALDFGYEAWQYDSYDVFLPFMLKNKGVILKYFGEGEVEGVPVDILDVTFDKVGPTPNAQYHLHIDKETRLLVRWDYYMDVGDEFPRFKLPWLNYEEYDNLWLSADRGKKQHTDIGVFDELPVAILTSPDQVNFPDPALN